MWQQAFALTNVVALVGWLLLLLGPATWLSFVRYGAVGLLCAIYVILFVALLGGWVDPVRAGTAPAAFDYSVRGLHALFASDGGVVVGWTHYLVLDLFTGCWIAERAARGGVARWMVAPVLVLTFLAGPLGLLLWFAVGRLMARPRGAG